MKTTIINYNETGEAIYQTKLDKTQFDPTRVVTKINQLEITDENEVVHKYSLIDILDALVAIGKKLKETE